MAKFLNAGAATYHLEDLIRQARARLVLVGPDLKFSGRTKELLEEKQAVDVRVLYGANDLPPDEIHWLRGLPFIRTHFVRNLRAKCYVNEESCLLTSLSLYDFSQVMNHEMGVLISRADDAELYREACDEVARIVRVSEEVRISIDKVDGVSAAPARAEQNGAHAAGKLSTHRLAKKLGVTTQELLDGLQRLGAIEVASGHRQLTAQGMKLGGEFRASSKFGDYFVWPENFELETLAATANGTH